MFQDRGLIPSEKLAGMMAAAILSDTVMFKSPTCTVRDIRTAERMARIADISLIILMLTDVLMEGTHILYIGDNDVISQAFSVTPKENEVFLPKIMSRKKQINPSLSALWG